MEKKLPWKVADLLKVGVSISSLLLISIVILSFIFPEGFPKEGSSAFTVGGFLIQEIIILLPIYFLIIRRYKVTWKSFGFVNIGWRATFLYFFKGFGIFVMTTIIMSLILSFLGYFGISIPGFAQQQEHISLFGRGAPDIVAAVVTLIFLAPIFEEFVFRGFLLQTLLHTYKPWIASTITALIFALIHLEFQSVGIIFILALIINRIYLKSRSVWPCMLFHIVNNAIAFSFEFFVR